MKLVSKSFNKVRNVSNDEENNIIFKNLDSDNLDILYHNIKKVLDLQKTKKMNKKLPYFKLTEDLTILHFIYFAKNSDKLDNSNISNIINDLSNLNIINKSEEEIKLRYDLILQSIEINEIRNLAKILLKEKKVLYLYRNKEGRILITQKIKLQ